MTLRTHGIALATACAFAAAGAHAQSHDHGTPAAPPAPPATDTVDHSTMDHSTMDHSGMDHAAMGHAPPRPAAEQAPRTPIPPITDADRAAAIPPMRGHDHGDGVFTYLLFDRLETWDADPGMAQAWEAQGWVGTDRHRLWLRSEGERKRGRTEGADIEALYGRPVARWWDLVAGVRHDIGPGPKRDDLAIGVIGTAPYKFEVEATAYVGASGRTAVRVSTEYELLLTNRLILQPKIEAEWHGKDDAARGIGAGLGSVEAGLRLRYEFTRRFAPYVGVVHERSFGGTADFMRDEGEATRDTRIVAGVRLWF